MQLDTNLFEVPEIQNAPASTNHAETVETSSIIERPSKTTKANVKYVRLSDADHAELVGYVRAANILRSDNTYQADFVAINLILDKNSGIWGSQLRKFSTLREVLEGVTEKLAKPHKYVKGRRGEDLSVKQLTAINVIVTALGCTPISIPAK